MDVSFAAKVEGADGPCGEVSTVIVHPDKQEVTHLVVQDRTLPETDQRWVPFDRWRNQPMTGFGCGALGAS